MLVPVNHSTNMSSQPEMAMQEVNEILGCARGGTYNTNKGVLWFPCDRNRHHLEQLVSFLSIIFKREELKLEQMPTWEAGTIRGMMSPSC